MACKTVKAKDLCAGDMLTYGDLLGITVDEVAPEGELVTVVLSSGHTLALYPNTRVDIDR